ISKFNPETKVFTTYDERDGLKYCRMIQSGYKAFHKGRSGKFYCGFMSSLAVFHPDSVKDNPNPPTIVLTDFKLNNKPVEIGDNSYLKKTITETKTIELPYYENILSFEFSALDYTAPGKNQYAYKMEGVDRDWVYTDATRRYVSYTNLDPGEYVFSVKGSNNDGVWNEEGVSVSIIINPPLWATWWAYILYLMFFVSLFTGVTRFYLNRQRLKHQLELEHEHAEKLGEIDQLKSRFFANISHEFRTPLTLILGPVKQIMNKIKNTKIKEELKLVHRNAHRLNGMVNQLLDLSKLEAGRMTLKTIRINIIPFLKGLVFSFASLAERKKIALNFNSDLEELLVYVDRDKVEKIIYNILSNAFKFTSEGGEIFVSVSKLPFNSPFIKGGKEEGSVEISISDTGIGISEDRIDNIFDRFYQVDGSHTREHEGTGIGLALTKELVELHKGEISVESEEDKRTTFIIRIPLGRDHLKPEEIIEEKVEEKKVIRTMDEDEFIEEINAEEKFDIETFTETGKPLLLIVEDNVDVRNYIKGYLGENYKIIEAVNGNDGFHKSLQSSPDLIVSDVMMPEMDGFELCEKLKTDERTSHIPIILLTAKASGQDKIGGLEMGADDYIMKPFDAEELQVRIKNLIDQRKKLRDHFKKEGLFEVSDENITSIDKKFLKKAIKIIHEHISDTSFSVDIFADEIAMSRSQLHRKLVALMGEAPSDLIRRVRLSRAAKLIENKFGNISEIALEVGFANPANFANSFRRQFNVSPSEYEIRLKN
ncbi:MAG: ATP-binding protein, partial [Chlorobium sp.]|nr:ATP-binding protein [Chlorobium sp.]